MFSLNRRTLSAIGGLLFGLNAAQVQAAEIQGKIEYIKVADNLVTFKTDSSTSYTKAACALVENTGIWTLPLSTNMGRAMYAALMTASSWVKSR